MTDITELVQREKFESWWERTQHNGNPPRFGWAQWREGDGYKVGDDESELAGMCEAWKAAGAELVEALEKAQRANAAQDDHINQQQDRINRMEKRNSELGKRLRGTEESLIAATDMVRELESRTVTVKLPADRLAESEVSDYDGTEFYRAGWNARGKADKEALTAQGIKWEAE
ncbi:TPA: hypothetical protein ACTY9J_001346 [Raoultella ornithinolytica]